MAAVGFDFGNFKSVVAVARNRGIDIITNEISNRFTPSMVGFTSKERLLGEAAKTQEVMNLRNTVTDLRSLLGRSLDEDDVKQNELPHLLYQVEAAEDGTIAARVNYQGEERVFSMTQLAAMFLTDLKQIAEAGIGAPVHDIVISVPPIYTDRQRHALINAAQIAGLNPVRLINESAAAALLYGITRGRELPEPDKDPRHVVFLDMGNSCTTVSVVAFTQEKAVIKATVCDRALGGRNIDMEIVNHFAQEIKEKYKVDVFTKPKALLRLRAACERVKKVLSANKVASFNVENLTDDIDVRSQLTREDLEGMIKHLVERVEAPIRVALNQAEVPKDKVDFVELIGGCTRVPAIKQRVADFFNREGILSTTLNQDEAVARGCAFQCAMISPLFKVRDYTVKDVNCFDIKVLSTSDEPNGPVSDTTVFKVGDAIPSTKNLTVYRKSPFEMTVQYASPAQLAPGSSVHIAKFRIKDVKPTKDGNASEIKIKIRLSPNGIIGVESAHLIEEVETGGESAEAAAPAGSAMATDDASGPAEPTKPAGDAAAGADAAAPSGPAAAAAPAPEEKKRRVKKVELPVEAITTALLPTTVQSMREGEAAMIASDKLIADTLAAKNQLEEFVYDMRGKLEGAYAGFMEDAPRQAFLQELSKTEEWLYDEGETATKSVFIERLAALKKVSQPVVERFQESEARPKAVADLEALVAQVREAATSDSEKYSHIEPADKAKVVEAAVAKEAWLKAQLEAQAKLAVWQAPAVRASQINAERLALQTLATSILNKPKPQPPAATPPPAPKAETAPNGDAPAKDGAAPEPPKEDGPAPMDTQPPAEDSSKMNVDLD